MAAPSLITKPSRWASKGRLEALGSPLLLAKARNTPKLANVSGVSVASLPPVIITSARRLRITCEASPTACAPAAQAVTVVLL